MSTDREQVPKRKPKFLNTRKKGAAPDPPPTAAPKKFTAFSASDTRAIEAQYQRLLEESEDHKDKSGFSTNPTVPVNEDFLFDVDVVERELAPVYWLGPIYEGNLDGIPVCDLIVGLTCCSQARVVVLSRRIIASTL